MALPHPPYTAAPTLTTARLTLRAPRLSDLPASTALWTDPEVVRYIGNRPATPEIVWARLLRYIGHWTVLGYGFWVAEDTATGAFVGEIGLADFKRDIPAELASNCEVGWVLARTAHGRGLATEGVRAALAWGDAELGAPRVTAVIEPANTASIAVATKCGFHELGATTYGGSAVTIYERP